MQECPYDIGHEPRGILIGTVQIENSAPGRTQTDLPTPRVKDTPEGMLGGSVQGAGKKRSSVFLAFAHAALIFGAAAGRNQALPSVVRKCTEQLKTGTDPFDVFACFPELVWHRIPCEVQEVFWSHVAYEFGRAAWLKQIPFMP